MPGAKQHQLREYLLGKLTEAEEEQVELGLLTEPDFAEEYDIVVNELTDDYIAGKCDGEDLKHVEEYFFKSPARRNKLKFALALKQRKSDMATDKGNKKRSFRPYLAIAASLLLVAGGFYIWRALSSQTELNKGLAALQSAFREERPFESRISELNYAPYISTRGPGTEKFDQNELRRAELILLQELKDRPTPAAHHALGKVFLAKRDFDKAIEQFDEALKGDPKNAQLYSDLGAAWLEKGKIDIEAGKNNPETQAAGKGMEELGLSLQNLNRALELDPKRLEALFNRALCWQHMLSPQAADDWHAYLDKDSTSPWADEARRNLKSLSKSTAAPEGPAQILDTFLDAYKRKDDEAAWTVMSQTREMITGKMVVFQLVRKLLKDNDANFLPVFYAGDLERKRSGDPYITEIAHYYATAAGADRAVLLHAQNQIVAGFDLCLQSKYADALPLFRGAQKQFLRSGNLPEARMVDYWIAYCENQNDNFAGGVKTLKSLVSYCQRQNYKWLESQALYLLGNSLGLLGETSKAVEYNLQALRLAEHLSDTYTQQKLLTEIAIHYMHLARPQRGLAFLRRSLELGAISLSLPRQAWRNLTFASEIFYSMRLYDAAATYELAALLLVEQHQWSASLAHLSKIHLGMIFAGMQRYDDATRYLNESLELANSRRSDPSSRRMIAYSFLELGNLKRLSGDHRSALEFYNRTVALYDHMEFELDRYNAHKGRLACYMAARDDDATGKELEYVLKLFEQYRSLIREEQNRNSYFDAGQSIYDMAVEFAFSKGDLTTAFNYSETARSRSLLDAIRNKGTLSQNSRELDIAFTSASQPLSLAQVQSDLPKDLIIVQYNLLKDRLLIWAISKEEVEVFAQSISGERLQREVISYVNAVTKHTTSKDDRTRQASALYDLLITPIESRLDPTSELCLIPDKALFYLPFGSLISPRTGEYLIAKQPLLFSPSASVFVVCSKTAESRTGPELLLAVGNPSFKKERHPELPALPDAEREVRAIASEYPQSAVFIGPQALRSSVLPQLRKASIIHFAGHYLVEESNPLNSRLLLADAQPGNSAESNGAISAGDIVRSSLPKAQLVVLSACQTGGERYFNGEGMVGMARTFLMAGAPVVVASQWPVESGASAQLMVKFHHYRKAERMRTALALRQAQLDLINGPDVQYREPFYWSAFFSVGGQTSY